MSSTFLLRWHRERFSNVHFAWLVIRPSTVHIITIRIISIHDDRSLSRAVHVAENHDDSITASAYLFLLSFYSRPRIIESSSFVRCVTSISDLLTLSAHDNALIVPCRFLRLHKSPLFDEN